MTLGETVDLLTVAAAFDQRTVGEGDAMAWHSVVGDLRFADARQAMLGHYADTRERVMPADVRRRVRELRAGRVQAAEIPPPPPELLRNSRAYCEALQAAETAIADGRDPQAAMRAIARTVRLELEAS